MSSKVSAARNDRWERALAELRCIYARAIARNGSINGAGDDTHQAGLADANRRAALAEQEAALWRATAEVLRLDRDICREQTQRDAATDRLTSDQYHALQLLGSCENGCSEGLMLLHGVTIDTMVDLIRGGLARAIIEDMDRGRPIGIARVDITDAGRRALRMAETAEAVPSLRRA